MPQSRRSLLPLIESLLEPERDLHRRCREHLQLMADQPNVADLFRQIEEIRISAEASATRERATVDWERARDKK